MTRWANIAQSDLLASRRARDAVADHIVIRGQSLALDDLIRLDLDDADMVAEQAQQFSTNQPFEHIVIDGLFDERLLDLLQDEFGDGENWQKIESPRETTYRSVAGRRLGPATHTYLNLVNSAAFTDYLSAITGISDLITDQTAMGGGLHETRAGGYFGIHRDFNYHRKTLLANTLVLITYLNRDWNESYGGSLELWDGKEKGCVQSILPVFGRTVLFRHSNRSFHGHPEPLAPPTGRTRRSITAYYYRNTHSDVIQPFYRTSTFLDKTLTRKQKAKMVVRNMVPPALWMAARDLRNWGRARSRI